jgi:hypothetical protein
MKRIFLLYVVIFIFGLMNHFGIAQTNYYKSIHFNSFQVYENSMIKTLDNGFAIAGYPSSFMKLDTNIQLKFYKRCIDTAYIFYRMIQTTDSGYVVFSKYNNVQGNYLIYKFDKNGNFIWSKRYFGLAFTSDIMASDDNGFYMGGAAGCPAMTAITRCNSNGDILWQKKSNINEGPMRMLRVSNNKILLMGLHRATDWSGILYLQMADTSGHFLWMKMYEHWNTYDSYSINDFEIIQTSDNNISVLINRVNGTSESSILHLDLSGNVLWKSKIVPNLPVHYYFLSSFTETADKGYLYVGSVYSDSATSRKLYIKTDSLNNIEWSRSFKNYSNDAMGLSGAFKVLAVNDKYYVFGLNASWYNSDEFTVAKLDNFGNGYCNYTDVNFHAEADSFTSQSYYVSGSIGSIFSEIHNYVFTNDTITRVDLCSNIDNEYVNENDFYYDFNIYPNPATVALNIDDIKNITRTKIYDLSGKLIMEIIPVDHRIDISNLAKGLYFIALTTDEGNMVRKFVKE